MASPTLYGITLSKHGTLQKKFVYQGWNLIAETNSSDTVGRKFTWGLDVSTTLQGAGGVGGLLMIQDGTAEYFPIYDGARNIVGLYNETGGIAAAYEYDAFGRITTQSGTYAASNPFRFSTKYTDEDTGLVYFGLRYYNPKIGRFINRDPIGENGGINLNAFVGNNPVNAWDYLGMYDVNVDDPEEDPVEDYIIWGYTSIDEYLVDFGTQRESDAAAARLNGGFGGEGGGYTPYSGPITGLSMPVAARGQPGLGAFLGGLGRAVTSLFSNERDSYGSYGEIEVLPWSTDRSREYAKSANNSSNLGNSTDKIPGRQAILDQLRIDIVNTPSLPEEVVDIAMGQGLNKRREWIYTNNTDPNYDGKHEWGLLDRINNIVYFTSLHWKNDVLDMNALVDTAFHEIQHDRATFNNHPPDNYLISAFQTRVDSNVWYFNEYWKKRK